MNKPSTLQENTNVNVHDFRNAFRYKSLKDLRFTYYIFLLLQKPWLVKTLSAITEWCLRNNIPVQWLIKSSIFKVFCAGENISEAIKTIKELEEYNVTAVLDYVSEGEKTEAVFNYNCEVITANIRLLAQKAPGNAISVKLSGLEDTVWLEKINNSVSDTHNKFDQARYEKFITRVDTICKHCFEAGIILYLDAEERSTQDVFDRVAGQMMQKYNRKKAIVFNTVQMYLTDRLPYIKNLIAEAEILSFNPGIKLVRGAYVEKERLLAAQEGRISPVHPDKQSTDRAFDQALRLCLEHSSNVYTCIASHNEQSNLLAAELISRLNIHDHQQKVKFSQLYGMSDNLTFNLAARGYSASKYIPYGEVKKAVPYLIRRAEENTSVGGQLSKELIYLEKELQRRKQQINSLFHY